MVLEIMVFEFSKRRNLLLRSHGICGSRFQELGILMTIRANGLRRLLVMGILTIRLIGNLLLVQVTRAFTTSDVTTR